MHLPGQLVSGIGQYALNLAAANKLIYLRAVKTLAAASCGSKGRRFAVHLLSISQTIQWN